MSRAATYPYKPDDPFTLEEARKYFLETYRLQTMPDSDNPAESQLMKGLGKAFLLWLEVPNHGRPAGWEPFWAVCKSSPALQPLHESLTEWAREFRLTYTSPPHRADKPEPADWVMDVVRETLEAWSKSGTRYSRREWTHPLHAHESYPGSTEPDWVSVRTGEPEPDLLKVEIASQRSDESLREFRRQEELNAQEVLTKKARGQFKTTTKIRQHFDWLLKKLEGGTSEYAIAAGAKNDESTVYRGIRYAAEFLQLDPPPRSSDLH